MMEEIPSAFIFDYAVVCGPAHDGLEEHAAVGEGSIGVVARGVTEEMGVARAVTEIIGAVVFVHPACLEEAMRVVGWHHGAVGVEDDDGL